MEDPKYTKALYDHLSTKLDLGTQADFEKQLSSDNAFRKAIYEQGSVDLDLGDYKTYDSLVKKKVASDYSYPTSKAFTDGVEQNTGTIPKDETTAPAEVLTPKQFDTPDLSLQSPEFKGPQLKTIEDTVSDYVSGEKITDREYKVKAQTRITDIDKRLKELPKAEMQTGDVGFGEDYKFNTTPEDDEKQALLEERKNLEESITNPTQGQYLFGKAYQQSIVGIAQQLITGTPLVSPDWLTKYDSNTLTDVTATAMGFLLDTPFFGAMGSVGAKAGQLAAKPIVDRVMIKTTERLIKAGIPEVAAKELALKAATKTSQAIAGMASSGVALGSYGAVQSALGDWSQPGASFDDIKWGNAFKRGGKDFLLGTSVGGLGLASSALVAKASAIPNAVGRIGTKVGVAAGGLTAESALFAYGGALLEGRSPKDVTGKEFMETVALLGMLKVSNAIQNPKETAVKLYRSAKFDPQKPGQGQYKVEIEPWEIEALGVKDYQSLMDINAKDDIALGNTMRSKDIPALLKQKILWGSRGVAIEDINTFGDKVVPNEEYVDIYNKEGVLLDKTRFSTKEEAAQASIIMGLQLEDNKMQARSAEPDVDRVAIVADLKAKGTDIKEVVTALDKPVADRTPEEDKIVGNYAKLIPEKEQAVEASAKALEDVMKPVPEAVKTEPVVEEKPQEKDLRTDIEKQTANLEAKRQAKLNAVDRQSGEKLVDSRPNQLAKQEQIALEKGIEILKRIGFTKGERLLPDDVALELDAVGFNDIRKDVRMLAFEGDYEAARQNQPRTYEQKINAEIDAEVEALKPVAEPAKTEAVQEPIVPEAKVEPDIEIANNDWVNAKETQLPPVQDRRKLGWQEVESETLTEGDQMRLFGESKGMPIKVKTWSTGEGNVIQYGGKHYAMETKATADARTKVEPELNLAPEPVPEAVKIKTEESVMKKLDKQSAIKEDKIFKEQKNRLLDDLISAEDILLGTNKENARKLEESATDQETKDSNIQEMYQHKLDALPEPIKKKLNNLGIRVEDGKLIVDIYKDGSVEVGDIRTALRIIDKGFPQRLKERRLLEGPTRPNKTRIRQTAESYGSLKEAENRVKMAEDNLKEAQRTDRTKKVGDKTIPVPSNKGLVKVMEDHLNEAKTILEEAKNVDYERIGKEKKINADKEFTTFWDKNKDTFGYSHNYIGRDNVYDIIEKQGRPEKLTYDTVEPLLIKDSLEEQKMTIAEKRTELTDKIKADTDEAMAKFGRKDGKGLRKVSGKHDERLLQSFEREIKKNKSKLDDLNRFEPIIKKLQEVKTETKTNEEPINKPSTVTGKEAGDNIPTGTDTNIKPVKAKGQEKPVTATGEKVELTKEEQLKAKETELKNKIATDLDDLMSSIGGIKKFTGEQRVKVVDALVKLMKDVGEFSILKGEQLWERVKQELKDRKLVIPDDVFAEAQGKYEGVSTEEKPGLVEGSHFTNAKGERFENGEEVVFSSSTGEKVGTLDIPEGKAPGLKVEGGVLPLTMADMEKMRKATPEEKTPPKKEKPKQTEPDGKDEKYRKTQVNALIQDRTLQQQTVADIVDANKEKYTVLHGEDAIAQAKKMIDEKGVQGATIDLSEPTKDMQEFPIRQVGRQVLLNFYSRAIIDKNATEADKEIAFKYITDLQKITAIEATKAGQGSSLLQIWKSMQPAGLLAYVERAIARSNDKVLDKKIGDTTIGKQIDELYGTLTTEAKKVIDDILAGRSFNVVREVTKPIKTEPKPRTKSYTERIKKEQTYRQSLIEQYKKANAGTMSLSVVGLNSAQIELGGNLIGSYLREANYRVQEVIDKLVKDFKGVGVDLTRDQVDGLLAQQKDKKETYRDYLDRKESVKRVREGEKLIDKKISSVIKEHWSEKDELKRTLAEKLMEEAGLTEAEAKKVEQEFLKDFDKKILELSQKNLTKILGTEKIPVEKTKKGLADKMIELINMGALDEGLYRDLFAEKFKLGKLTDEHKTEILRLANNLQQSGGKGWLERDASIKLAKYIYELYPVKKSAELMETWIAMAYSNMLSGPFTSVLNLWSAGSNMIIKPIRDVTNLSKWLKLVKTGIKGEGDIYNPFGEMIYSPMLRGVSHGWNEAKEVYINGDLNNKYMEEIAKKNQFKVTQLERDKYGKSKRFMPIKVKIGSRTFDLNPFNAYKYAGRNLAAQDKMMLTTSYEMEIAQILRDKLKNKDLKGRALTREVMAIFNGERIDMYVLNKTLDADIALYRELNGKSMTPLQIKIRKRELMFEQLPITKEEKAEAEALARGNIFTDDRGGLFATAAQGIGALANSSPAAGLIIKPFVPFTKVVGNVTEYMMDHVPFYGLLRANGLGVVSMIKHRINPELPTAQMGAKGSRAYYEQMGRAWFGTLAFSTAMAFLLGKDDEDFAEVSGGYAAEGFKKSGRQNVLPPYTLRIGKVMIPYKNVPSLAIPLALIGNLNDGLKSKQDEGDLQDRLTAALLLDATANSVLMIKDMSFLDGVQRGTQMIADAASGSEKKWASIGENAAKTYLGFIARPLPQNNNAVQQIWKIFDPTAYSQGDIKGMLGYAAGLQHFVNHPVLDQFGEKVKTYPGETLLPYTHWLGIKGKDERWSFLAANNAIPNKIYNSTMQIETEDGFEKRQMEEDELYDYTLRAGTIFSDGVKSYMSDKEKVATRASESIERTKPNGDIEKISGVREDVEKLWIEAKNDAVMQLFRWSEFRTKNPKGWEILKNNNALQMPEIPPKIGGKSTKLTWKSDEEDAAGAAITINATREDVQEFNRMAMDAYYEMITDYLSEEPSMTEIDEKNGGLLFDSTIKKLWSKARKVAIGQIIETKEK